MPELPEVETMRRGILPIVRSRVTRLSLVPCARRPIGMNYSVEAMNERVAGQEVIDVERLGKRVLIRLATTDALVFEPRMTGLVLVADPPSSEHLRLRLDLTGGPINTVWYWDRRGLGSVRLFTGDEVITHVASGLGIDALAITVEQLRSELGTSRRAIKVALLDQTRVAGIGNLYASEILHRAKVHPENACDALRLRQWKAIHRCLLEVLDEAILHEGSTLSDGTYRNALNKSGGYQNCHRVYDRAGEKCQQCRRGEIERIVQAQRSTFLCPRCQQ